MLALLGWNPGTEQELFSLDELVNLFDLERVHKSGAKFDPEKTNWFQHHYLQEVRDVDLAEKFRSILMKRNISTSLDVIKIVSLLKERATFVDDLWDQSDFFFVAPVDFNEQASKKAFKEGSQNILKAVAEIVSSVEPFTAEDISKQVKEWITSKEIGFGKVMMPLRLALVGEMKGPDVFEIAYLLGKEETLGRLNHAINYLSQK